jgi:predicted GNAT family acetyltransferase
VRTLAQGMVERDQDLPGAIGLVPWVHDFATDWSALTGTRVEEDKAERLFRLDSLLAPQPVPGKARPAAETEVDLLVEWMLLFLTEVGLEEHLAARRSVETAVLDGRCLVWELDGEVVSKCGHGVEVGGQVRIGPVYTPPELRGHGYASNLVAHVTTSILERGLVPTLFTDLANPTSNGIYTAMGYRRVADAFMLRFRPADSGSRLPAT